MKQLLGAKPLLFPAPVLVVGTCDQAGKPNPLVYDVTHKGYHRVGPLLGRAVSVGRKLL